MVTNQLDDRELQLLIVALRYWRNHRASGVTRKTDPELSAESVDQLLAKLSSVAPRTFDRRSPLDATDVENAIVDN